MATDEQTLPLTIRVLEGDLAQRPLMAGQPPGLISLGDRSLPYYGFRLGGSQRKKNTWYWGNPKSSLQAMGPQERPTSIHGVWKDRYVGDGQARALALMFMDLRRRGPLVEVSWGAGVLTVQGVDQVGDPFTMQGIVSDTDFNFEIPGRCEWKVEFEWNGLDDLVAAPVMGSGILNAREGLLGVNEKLDGLSAQVTAFRSFVQTRLVGLPARLEALLDDRLTSLNDASDAVRSAAGAAARVTQLQAATPIVGTLANATNAARAVALLAEQFNYNQLAATDGALEILQAKSNVLVILGLARAAVDYSGQAAESLGQDAAPDIIAEVRVPAGTDLREVAARYYDGDADGWVEIADENGFATSVVPMPPSGPSDVSPDPIRVPVRRAQGGLAGGC